MFLNFTCRNYNSLSFILSICSANTAGCDWDSSVSPYGHMPGAIMAAMDTYRAI